MKRVMEITETQVSVRLAQSRIIALAAVETAEQAELAGATLMRAGVTIFELATPNAALVRAARRVPDLLVGAGHVHTAEQAEAALRGGAHFATAPATNMEVVHAAIYQLDLTPDGRYVADGDGPQQVNGFFQVHMATGDAPNPLWQSTTSSICSPPITADSSNRPR